MHQRSVSSDLRTSGSERARAEQVRQTSYLNSPFIPTLWWLLNVEGHHDGPHASHFILAVAFVELPGGLMLPRVMDSSSGRKTRDDADAGVDGDVDSGVDVDGEVIFGWNGVCECRWETDGLLDQDRRWRWKLCYCACQWGTHSFLTL